MMNHSPGQKGFTFIEIMVVMAISISVFLFSDFLLAHRQPQASLDAASSELLSNLRLTQSRSVSAYASSSWGIYFDGNDRQRYTIYAGNSYDDRREGYSQVIDMGPGISWQTINPSLDFRFSMISGMPMASTSILVLHRDIPKRGAISINKLGKIERDE